MTNVKIISIFTGQLLEEFEDTKGGIRTHKWKDRQHNNQLKKDKRTNNDTQSNTMKTKDRMTRTPQKR